MTFSVGLSIGESFAEARIDGDSGFLRATRWHLLRKSAAEGLQELLKSAGVDPASSGRLRYASSSRDKTLSRKQGQTPAVLVTAGFESWIKTQLAAASPVFSLEPRRAWAPIEDDFIFGVSARADVDGTIQTPMSAEDIEFLAAKLELTKTRQIALAFLHSKKNPSLEIEAKQLLEKRGFQVFASHEQPPALETERWLGAIEAAYCDPSQREEAASLGTALPGWTIESVRDVGASLKQSFGDGGGPIALHLGLEQFNLLEKTHAGWSERRLPLSATQEIVAGPWPHPELSSEMSGFEPGPMMFGKSQTLTILDVLFVRDRLGQTLEGLTPMVSEKSRPRIWEAILTLGRSAAGGAEVDERLLAEDLETLFIDRLAQSLVPALAALGERAPARVELTGAFAGVLAPLLSKRRPDLDFVVSPDAEFALALAAGTGGRA